MILGTMDLHAASGRDANMKHRGSRGSMDRGTPEPSVDRLQALAGGDVRISLDPATGLAKFVGFGPSGFAGESRGSQALTEVDRAMFFLREFGPAFGVVDADGELELAESQPTPDGTKLRFIQLHRGLRVAGGELRMYFDTEGNLTAVDSRLEAGLDIDPYPVLTRQAIEAKSPTGATTGPLVVYRTDSGDGLAYESELPSGSDPGERVMIDGSNGHVIPPTDEDPTPETKVETRTLTVGAAEQTVQLIHEYESPVVVCSAGHANNTAPAVVRVTGLMSDSFDIRLQNPGDLSTVYEETVHCIVAEEGLHTVDGHTFEAQKYTTAITDKKDAWNGTGRSYLHNYNTPVVIGQVIGMDDEELGWSVFWNKGQTRTVAPNALSLTTGRTVLEDADSDRGIETVAFMVFESGHGIFAGVEFETGVGPQTISGEPNGAPFAYSFETPFASAPAIALNQMAGVVGGDGGWSQTHGAEPTTASTLNLFIDEDQVFDAERSHALERVGYAVFAADFTYPALERPARVPCEGSECGGDTVELKIETFTIDGVDGTFQTVPLAHTYASPVAVCNVNYVNNWKPVVTRIRNVTANAFDIKLQNPSGETIVADDVTCIVLEEGAWQTDGVRFEAQRYEAPVTDRHTRWTGRGQSYRQSYVAPVVVGQVMSFNDADFSVYWQKGELRDVAPSATALTNGMSVLQDVDVTRNREIVGFIVFESGHGAFLDTAYEAATGANSVRGVHDATPSTYVFEQAFARQPHFAVTSMAGANGGDGGWSQLHGSGALTAGTLNLSIDEDQILDRERSHMAEQVNYIVFENDVVFPAPLPNPIPRRSSGSSGSCDGVCDIR